MRHAVEGDFDFARRLEVTHEDDHAAVGVAEGGDRREKAERGDPHRAGLQVVGDQLQHGVIGVGP